MKKTITILLLAVFSAFASSADDYDVEVYDFGIYVTRDVYVKTTIPNALDIFELRVYYNKESGSCEFQIGLIGLRKNVPWMKEISERIVSRNLLGLTALRGAYKTEITFSNGTKITTSECGFSLVKLPKEQDYIIAIRVIELSDKEFARVMGDNSTVAMSGEEVIDLFWQYDITSITIDGHTSSYSNSETAKHFNKMLGLVEKELSR